MRIVRSFARAAAIVALFSQPAFAQGDPGSDRDTARALAERGFELLEQNEPEKAIVSFRMAERRIHSPVHQLFIARAEVKLGKLADAIAVYESVVAEKIAAGSPKPFFDAQNDAKTELEALKVRTPSINITVSGAPKRDVKVTIDGAPIKPEALGAPLLINPGKHTIVASAPDASPVEKTLTLVEGSYVQALNIRLVPGGVPTSAIVAFSIGGAGLIAGTATGVAYLGKTNPNPTLGVISLVGIAAGGVGIVTGTLLAALGGSSEATPQPATTTASRSTLRVGIGPGSLSVGGSFD